MGFLYGGVFKALCQRWEASDVDLLTSRRKIKLYRFVPMFRNPQAFTVEALVILWDQFNMTYAFPPLQILPRLLHRVVRRAFQ